MSSSDEHIVDEQSEYDDNDENREHDSGQQIEDENQVEEDEEQIGFIMNEYLESWFVNLSELLRYKNNP